MSETKTYTGTAYCVKCREKRDFTGPITASGNNRYMAKGECPVCKTKMNRMLGKKDVPQ